MADAYIKRIKNDPTNEEIKEYLDYLSDRLTYILENIDTENLTDNLNRRIGG